MTKKTKNPIIVRDKQGKELFRYEYGEEIYVFECKCGNELKHKHLPINFRCGKCGSCYSGINDLFPPFPLDKAKLVRNF